MFPQATPLPSSVHPLPSRGREPYSHTSGAVIKDCSPSAVVDRSLPALTDAMSAADLIAHAAALRETAGCTVSIGTTLSEYRRGACEVYFAAAPSGHLIYAETWPEVIEAARAYAQDRAQQRCQDTIRRMALAIIEITDRDGACLESSLARAGFSRPDIEALGADACARADRMGQGGSFVIVPEITP